MPSVFIYEFLTAGGFYSLGSDPPAGSLLAEGTAMRDALAADFASCEFVNTVHLLHDTRLPAPDIAKQVLSAVESCDDEHLLLQRLANETDYSVIIAPEFASCLETRALWTVQAGGKLLSPDAEFVRLAANKHRSAEYLTQQELAVPRGIHFGNRLPLTVDPSLFPAVLKPLDGAGSTNVHMVKNRTELAACNLALEGGWRLEKYCPGLPASVSYLAGPHGAIILPACSQRLSDDGKFQYQGGATPLAPDLAERAKQLARRVAAALPATTGYVGIDIVLGPAENGSEDFVIEVNPRLTTSYLGLRQACQQNLAEAMLRWALGERVELSFYPHTISFAAGQRS
jgi:predicted ATP-grasp superfamily ATP-dependent carboligase